MIRALVKCTRACLDLKAMLVSSYLVLVDHHTPFTLVPLEFPILAPCDLAYMHKHEARSKCAMHGVQSAI
jgi:hypothetical protein